LCKRQSVDHLPLEQNSSTWPLVVTARISLCSSGVFNRAKKGMVHPSTKPCCNQMVFLMPKSTLVFGFPFPSWFIARISTYFTASVVLNCTLAIHFSISTSLSWRWFTGKFTHVGYLVPSYISSVGIGYLEYRHNPTASIKVCLAQLSMFVSDEYRSVSCANFNRCGIFQSFVLALISKTIFLRFAKLLKHSLSLQSTNVIFLR